MTRVLTTSDTETIDAGYRFGLTLEEGDIVFLQGDVGAGKTTFVKGIAKAQGDPQQPLVCVNSPTFVYLNIYHGLRTIYHFDLYRMKHSEHFLEMGFDEYLFSNGISCIEWPEKMGKLMPTKYYKVVFENLGKEDRSITFYSIM